MVTTPVLFRTSKESLSSPPLGVKETCRTMPKISGWQPVNKIHLLLGLVSQFVRLVTHRTMNSVRQEKIGMKNSWRSEQVVFTTSNFVMLIMNRNGKNGRTQSYRK